MSKLVPRGRRIGRVLVFCAAAAGVSLLAARRTDGSAKTAEAANAVAGGVSAALTSPITAFRDATTRPHVDGARLLARIDSLRGRSGKLFARQVPRSSQRLSFFAQLFGDTVVRTLGVHDLKDSTGSAPFSVITIRDFAEKLNGSIGSYRIGYWPSELGRPLGGTYGNPMGFIEVTPDNANTQVSEHFRLRDFLTHDQERTWPKYLVLREDLVDKLELVIAQLQGEGHAVRHMSVMSGFRTPQYNATGGETGGRASLSRHMYGDAADVFVDNDGDGQMDDLNHDGRVDYRDAQVILDAAEKVERAHPDVTGGVGVYKATSSHGPFAHVDVRGNRARWGLL
jgi:uncharacterized protein YcbK (DUF882 family)